MNETLDDLRALRARARVKQEVLAERMGISNRTLSRVLCGHQRLTDSFEAAFRTALAELVKEQAAREKSAIDERARKLLAVAGVEAKVAA